MQMRIESPTYLPVPGTRRQVNVTPVDQIVLTREDHRNTRLDEPEGPGPADGFEDALMQVSIPDRRNSSVAMLFEVQRLAQGAIQQLAGGEHFQAALAYGTSTARQQIEQQKLTLPMLRA